jgi:hypothetical protein
VTVPVLLPFAVRKVEPSASVLICNVDATNDDADNVEYVIIFVLRFAKLIVEPVNVEYDKIFVLKVLVFIAVVARVDSAINVEPFNVENVVFRVLNTTEIELLIANIITNIILFLFTICHIIICDRGSGTIC